MKTIILAALGVASVAAVAPAAAQVPAPRAQQVQTRADLPRQVQTMFVRLDVNRDGFVTRDEAQAGRQPADRGARGNRRAFDPQRALAERGDAFDRIDTDRNGVITRDEFARRTALRQQRQALRGSRGGRGFAGLRGRMFEAADFNRDNRITIQEATAAAVQRFDRSDLNRDGQLSREERRQSRQLLRPQRQRG